MKFTILVLLAFVLLSCSNKNTKETKPNIIFLLADDQRAGTINALGNTEVITPNLDKIANEGVTFNNAYLAGAMNGAVCAPSRAMLMTGRSLFNIDPTGNTIAPEHTTLPKALANAGYHTFHIGKWHNGKQAFKNSFTDGSKIFFGGMHSQYNVPTYEFNQEGDYSKEMVNTPSPKHSSELYADAGVNFIQNYNSEKPFFLYLAFQAPHDPREMPKEYLDMYDTANISLPPNFMTEHPFDNGELDIRDEWLAGYPRTPEEVKANIAAYYAMITHLDAQIGRVMEAVEKKGLMENTIIVFSADNGLAVGQHGLMGKQNLYEHSVHVPLIFKGKGLAKGESRDAMAYLYDIYPTLCEFAGAEVPSTVKGLSLKPVIDKEVERVRESLFFSYKNFQRAVRKNDWKLIKYNVGGNTRTQLFNLKADPFETNDLSADPLYEAQLNKMNQVLRSQMKAYNDEADLDKPSWGVPVLPAWKDKVDKETVDHLRELAEKEREMRGF
ncbi:sulfatase-like hydrolase/transferase [uncultured Draconibacterium sp.]|uniref:sulfatase-like hydrolase/transferase n=1 Tax=uncultured Draconibacterium sp. TaxID=1573823 RepID=UPI003260744A